MAPPCQGSLCPGSIYPKTVSMVDFPRRSPLPFALCSAVGCFCGMDVAGENFCDADKRLLPTASRRSWNFSLSDLVRRDIFHGAAGVQPACKFFPVEAMHKMFGLQFLAQGLWGGLLADQVVARVGHPGRDVCRKFGVSELAVPCWLMVRLRRSCPRWGRLFARGGLACPASELKVPARCAPSRAPGGAGGKWSGAPAVSVGS